MLEETVHIPHLSCFHLEKLMMGRVKWSQDQSQRDNRLFFLKNFLLVCEN